MLILERLLRVLLRPLSYRHQHKLAQANHIFVIPNLVPAWRAR